MAIARFGPSRSAVSAWRSPDTVIAIADFGMAITDFGDGDHLRTALSSSWAEVVA
jgi:hypothetical protein